MCSGDFSTSGTDRFFVYIYLYKFTYLLVSVESFLFLALPWRWNDLAFALCVELIFIVVVLAR